VAGDILDYADFFLPDDQVPYDAKAFDKHIRKPPAPELLGQLRGVLADATPFDAATVKSRVEEFAQAEGVKAGPLSQMLRVAVTGKEIGFGAYETLETLGRERCLARIDRAIAIYSMLQLEFPPATKERMNALVAKARDGSLTSAEQEELGTSEQASDLLAQLKSKAR
jgi:hypothetical protein